MINKFTLSTDTFSKEEFNTVNKVMMSRNYTMGDMVEKFHIETRPIIAGNILKHPALKKVNYRHDKNLPVANNCLENGFMIGCHSNIGDQQLELFSKVIKILKKF